MNLIKNKRGGTAVLIIVIVVILILGGIAVKYLMDKGGDVLIPEGGSSIIDNSSNSNYSPDDFKDSYPTPPALPN